MNKPLIYALDFDGVICDSAVETAITGWKAGLNVWSDMVEAMPSDNQIDQFRELRPALETGYEAILLMRLVYLGESIDSILSNNLARVHQLLLEIDQSADDLKRLFGETRDTWIEQSLSEWVCMNPLFDGVASQLQQLTGHDWYIVTTKQERFVEKILQANQIELSAKNIFGLDKRMSKEAVLTDLLVKHEANQICFIEDRLPTLLNVLANPALDSIDVQLVDWGYNTAADKAVAHEKGIQLIALQEFLQH